MLKEHGEKAVEGGMQQIGQLFAANIRQNDLCLPLREDHDRAGASAETAEKEAVTGGRKVA